MNDDIRIVIKNLHKAETQDFERYAQMFLCLNFQKEDNGTQGISYFFRNLTRIDARDLLSYFLGTLHTVDYEEITIR